jgi:hypothetical protein
LVTVLAAIALILSPVAAADGLDDIAPRDSWGLSIFDYRLSFNNGGGIVGPIFTADTTGSATFAYVMFAVFLPAAAIGLMALKILLKADWLTPLVKVIDATANRLYEQIGLPFALAMVTATLMITAAIFSLRNKGGRLWHHMAVTIVCVVVGASIAFPVAEAAKFLGMGRDAAVDLGQSLTGGTLDAPATAVSADPSRAASDPTAVLVDEWVRKPIQRWNFGGQDLDSISRQCGEAWNSRVTAGAPDKIKNAPFDCLGKNDPRAIAMHDAAMDPASTLVFSVLSAIFGVILCVMLLSVVVSVLGVSVVALLHAGLLKAGLMAAGTQAGQNFLIRNGIDAPIAALMFFGGLLGVYVSAAVAKILAVVVPSSTTGMMLIVLLLAATRVGIRKVIGNLKIVPQRVARSVTSGSGQSALARSAAGRAGRAIAGTTAARYAARRAARRVARKAITAAAPEAVTPSAVASTVRSAARRVRGGVSGQTSAAQSSGATNSAPAAQNGNQSFPYGGAAVLSPAQYARVVANLYRSSRRAAPSMPTGGGHRAVAGREAQARAMAAAGAAVAPGYHAGGAGRQTTPAGQPLGVPSAPSGATMRGRQPSARAARNAQPGSATASAARNTARTYRDRNRS